MQTPTFVINLSSRFEKNQRMKGRLKQVESLSWSFFYGVDIMLCNKLNKTKYTTDFIDKYGKGALGCAISHSFIYEGLDIVKNVLKPNHYLIMEDDVVLCEDFDIRFKTALELVEKENPNWCMLYLGFTHVGFADNLPESNTQTIVNINGEVGAFAYVINKKFLPVLIEATKVLDKPIDMILAILQKSHPCYACNPFLVYVEDGYSDTSNTYVSFEKIKENFKNKL